MSNNTAAKNAAAAVEEKVTVPSQNKNEKLAADVQEAVAANTMIDALKKVEDQLADGVTVKVQVAEDGSVSMEVVEGGKLKGLADKAKGVFKRNKKLVLATAGLATASLVLKVIAARRDAELEADEVVESSDDVAVDA